MSEKPSVKPSVKPEVKTLQVTFQLKVGEYLIPIVQSSETIAITKRIMRGLLMTTTVIDTIPHIIVSRYEIDVKDLDFNKIMDLIKVIKEKLSNILYDYYIDDGKLIIFVKARKIDFIEKYLNELKQTIKSTSF